MTALNDASSPRAYLFQVSHFHHVKWLNDQLLIYDSFENQRRIPSPSVEIIRAGLTWTCDDDPGLMEVKRKISAISPKKFCRTAP